MKLAQVPMDTELRQRLVDALVKRKKSSIKVYCWEDKNGIAPEAFLSQSQAVTSWYVKKRLWEQEEIPRGAVVYQWEIPLDELLEFIEEKKICNIPIPKKRLMEVAILPSELHQDLRQTVQKQG